MLAAIVAARHSGALGGRLGLLVSHRTCHLNRTTAEANTLNRPTSALQFEQETCRNPLAREPSSTSAVVSNEASDFEVEN